MMVVNVCKNILKAIKLFNMMKNIRVIEVATRRVISVSPETTLLDLLEKARKMNLHSFPVIDEGKFRGIVGLEDLFSVFYPYKQMFQKYEYILHAWEKIYEEYEKDLFSINIKKSTLKDMEVKDIMKYDAQFVYENSPLKEAYEILKNGRIKLLPVLNQQKEVVGVITFFDIIYFLFTQIKQK